MNNSDFITIAALQRELDHIKLKYGFNPEPKDNKVYMPSDRVWLPQSERLTIITDYIQNRLEELQK